MPFFGRVGNLLKQAVNKQISSQSSSSPSVFQSIRCMSSAPSSKLFIGGLPYSTDERSLQEAFSRYGTVVDARVVKDRETGRSRGFGFVTFTSVEEASSAIQALDQKDLHGRIVSVDYANDRTRGFSRGGYGNAPFGGSGTGGRYGDSGAYGSNAAGGYGSGGFGPGSYASGSNYGSGGSGNNYGTDSFGSGSPGDNYSGSGVNYENDGNFASGSTGGYGGNTGNFGVAGAGGGSDNYGRAPGFGSSDNFGSSGVLVEVIVILVLVPVVVVVVSLVVDLMKVRDLDMGEVVNWIAKKVAILVGILEITGNHWKELTWTMLTMLVIWPKELEKILVS
ncbi:hypothetical protein L6164_014502 [Bauhinia variegata]|uniref:Uncharacterized protein n=1 Tax=Bauhinia variegata TaxID=167791 RepID=A0ACB9NHP7_BAUVA|nr:hypothetical protein L6164_014502 [Bauhinia variegata]